MFIRQKHGDCRPRLTKWWEHVKVRKSHSEPGDYQSQQEQAIGKLVVVIDADLVNDFWRRSRCWLMAVKLARVGKSCDRPFKLGRRWAVTRGKQTTSVELANAGLLTVGSTHKVEV